MVPGRFLVQLTALWRMEEWRTWAWGKDRAQQPQPLRRGEGLGLLGGMHAPHMAPRPQPTSTSLALWPWLWECGQHFDPLLTKATR